ncbi:MAG: FAD-binding domain-containing protein [Cyanobacteriota bacterium]
MGEPFVVALALEGQLRLDDQPALHQAVALARRPEQDNDLGQAKLLVLACRPPDQRLRGPHQRRLEAQALACLNRRLAAESIPLLHFPQHSTAAALELLAPLVRPQAVLHCQESRLFDDWPLAQESFPRVFAEFRRGLRQAPQPPLPVPDLGGLGGLRLEGLLGWREPAGIDAVVATTGEDWVADPRSAFPFAGDEASGLARLRHYCLESDGLRHYKQRRNGLVGTEVSSKVSPYLAIGSLSVRRIWQTVLDYQARCGVDDGSEWLKQELLWREFFLWTAQLHGASFGAPGGLQNRRSEAIEDRELFGRWCRGRSGHPLIDAQLNELRTTGYLSNRGRQWVASHFINELRLPWTWGARFFEWWLIDAQPALNTGNWAYLAGVGNDPRSFNGPPRRFDLERQVRLYDPEEIHRRLWS